jgi:thiol-disulfide isomerase/thioredoxin
MTYVSSEKEFNSLIVDKVLIEFTAPECHACSLAEPFLIELEKAYPFKIGLVDITYNFNIMRKYNVTVVPTFIMFEEQKELFRINGFRNKFDIEKQLRRFK